MQRDTEYSVPRKSNGLFYALRVCATFIPSTELTLIYILNHPSNVVAQLTKMCRTRPVGCCPVTLSPSWFVAQMTIYPSVQQPTHMQL